MFQAVPSPHIVSFDGAFELSQIPTRQGKNGNGKKEYKDELEELCQRMGKLQHKLFAQDRWALLVIFQAMDAAGKDGAIRHVFTGVNPTGLEVSDFKRPTPHELDHDWLWRSATRLPPRGKIGIFNRSYYEEVLVVRVFPQILDSQRLPARPATHVLWEQRLSSIRDHELHLARNGTAVLKFCLHISREEQKKRFMDRLNEPEKHWKFNPGDLDSRDRWADFQAAYQAALSGTSRPWAPWYVIPADDKHYARAAVARIVVETLESLQPSYPVLEPSALVTLGEMKRRLESESA